MYISISSIKFSIPFMFPDPEDLRQALHQMLSREWDSPETFKRKYGRANLDFMIVLDRKTKDLEIKGPTIDEELVDFVLWLPYKEIKSSSNYRMSYLRYIKEGMLEVLSRYDFNLDPFKEIFSTLEQKEIERDKQGGNY